jgi:hypothetical protein
VASSIYASSGGLGGRGGTEGLGESFVERFFGMIDLDRMRILP